jgi:RNA polymerase sigma-70 factor (ECF subfamily)
MNETPGLETRLERHTQLLMQWATTQTPAWLRAKLDPADLVQQTLMEGLKAGFVSDSKADHEVLAVLRRILANNLIDAVRKFGRGRADVSPDVFADSSRRMGEWLAAPDTSPSERYDRNERFDKLAQGLATLPDAQRIVVEMRYLQGAKVSEIARSIQRTEGAVAALLHRGVTALRNELTDL